MNLNESRQLREERAKIAKDMSDLATGGLKTSEDRTKFDALDVSQKELKERIDRIEAAGKTNEEVRGSGKPPAGQPGADETESAKEKEKIEKRAKAFRSYLKYGLGGEHRVGRMNDDDRQLVLEMRDMGTSGQAAYPGITSGAGIFVPVGFVDRVTEALKYYGPMVNGGPGDPDIMTTATGQPLPFPTDNDTTNTGELIGEGQQVTTADVVIGSVILGAFKFSTRMVKVSIELLQDSAFDIENYLVKKFATRMGRILNTKFTTGVGSTEPFGIVTQATLAGTAAGANTNDGISGANTIGSDDLVTLEHSIDPLYRRQGKWMFNDSVLAAIKKVKDRYGRPLWLPGVAVNAPDSILGYQYLINNDMDALQTQVGSPPTTAKVILFGDLTLYQIRRVRELMVLRLEERFADQGLVAFIGFSRWDAATLDAGTHPIKYLKTVY